MNTCKTPRAAAAIALMALTASVATAQVQVNVPANPPLAASRLSRSDVIADYLVWRASGLEELHRRGQHNLDTSTREYALATARYKALRESPQFGELVESVRLGGGAAKVVIASMSATSARP